jgi:hypothetical protein
MRGALRTFGLGCTLPLEEPLTHLRLAT